MVGDDEDPIAGDIQEMALRAEACQREAEEIEWLKELKRILNHPSDVLVIINLLESLVRTDDQGTKGTLRGLRS